jgi:hypothetical protein
MKRKKRLLWIILSITLGTTSLFAKSETRWEEYAKDLRTPVKTTETKKQSLPTQKRSEHSGWHAQTKVKLTASDGTVYEQGDTGVFGELRQSKNQKDKQDVLSNRVESIQVVFPQYSWHSNKGEYSSDYRHWRKSKENEKEVWTFQVKIPTDLNLSNAILQISLDGVYEVNASTAGHNVTYIESSYLPEKAKVFNLVDVDSGVMYFNDELKDLKLDMKGLQTRTFRWVRGIADKKDYDKVSPEMYEDEPEESSSVRGAKTIKDSSSKEEKPKDFIQDPPRDPNDHFGPPPSF